MSQGEVEGTGNNLDVALIGRGFLAVQDGKNGKETALTRDGRLAVDKKGFITLADGSNRKVLDQKLKPVQLDPTQGATLLIGQNGEVSQSGEQVAQLGVFDVPDPESLVKLGGSLLRYTGNKKLQPGNATLRSGSIELSNVDSASELVQLMDAQRQLEANANMIRYQDQTLGRLVNDVGKIT